MSDEDSSLTEKRVFAGGDEATTAFVASEFGLARVAVSDDIVGEFSLEHRGETTAVASDGRRLAVGTPDDVFVGDDDGFYGTDFGAAVAVDYHDSLVASDGERVARYDGAWETVAEIDGVRAIDGDMVAATSGVHRLDGTHVGLEAVRDVSSAGTPLAGTAEGLYYLANGWMRSIDGSFTCVSSDGDRAHAATRETLYARSSGGTWTAVALPVDGSIVDIACGDGVYAVTADGVFLANVGDGWRHRSLGLSGVSGIAVV
ncbi:MAG: HVO_0234 family beta-propeller protein [Halobacteriota archaeon]|uniref:HVO_0234 family beta-propeller protein n=1 Tax=Natronomonas sp. TaxID=2184060 RepID=UPI0039758628